VPAVLIAGQWGLLGTLGTLLLFLTLALLAATIAPWGGVAAGGGAVALGRGELQRAAGTVAGFTLALVSVYMLLANYDLLPFTGRNVYLLGLDSHADVLESLELAILLAFGGAAAAEGASSR
jgi:hypothetical protein